MTASSSLKGSGSTCATLHIHVGIDLLRNDNSILRHRGQSLNVPGFHMLWGLNIQLWHERKIKMS